LADEAVQALEAEGHWAAQNHVDAGLRTERPGSPHADELFRLLVEAVVDYAIFLLDHNGRVLTWNVGAERIKGYRADEIIGRHFSAFYTPEDAERGRPAWVLGQATAHGRVEDQGWRVRKDGTRFWADVSVTAIRGPNGISGFAKVTRDMTDRHAAAERERQLLVEREGRRVAEEALRARDRFLSIASHELRTPIATVQIVAEALLRAHANDTLDSTRLVSGLARLDTSVQRLSTLLNELLDVSRLTAGANPLRREPTDIGALVEDVVQRFKEIQRADRVDFSAQPDVRAPVDATRLEQVVTNLLDNALRYSNPPSRIEVTVGHADEGVQITVRDRGMGLSGDAQGATALFEAFWRGEAASRLPGLGLGLYISRQIVEEHGGRISGASEGAGKGSTFRVWLPSHVDGSSDGA
jgi:PAS domain S-box-containing protein